MANIYSFTVWGLAGRREPISFKLDRSLNVFWGLNGTGKTSMLKILHAALQNSSQDLSEVPFSSAEVIFWSDAHQTHFRRRFEKSRHGDTFVDDEGETWELVDGHYQAVRDNAAWESEIFIVDTNDVLRTTEKGIDRKALETPYRHSYLPISRMSDVTAIARRTTNLGIRNRIVDDSFLDEQFAQHVSARWQEYNSAALTEIRAIQQQGLAQILAILFGGAERHDEAESDGVVTPLIVRELGGREAYVMVFQFLRQQGIMLPVTRSEFIESYERDGRLQDVIRSIEATTEREQQTLKPQQEFSNAIGRLYSGGKALLLEQSGTRGAGLRVRVGDEFIPIKSLSSGEKQLLRLMLEVLAAESNPVMIDEPELSMHPDWQLVLVDTMQKINPYCQLILATHSPEVMTEVPNELVFQL